MAQPNLTDSQSVLDWLRDPVPENKRWIIEEYIAVASSMIREVTKRRFTEPRELDVIREYRTYGTDIVYVDEVFSESDLISVVDENGVYLTYDADFDRIDPVTQGCELVLQPTGFASGSSWRNGGLLALPPDHGELFITELSYPVGALAGGSDFPRKVLVRGNFGWEKIPAEIEFAARRTVGTWFREEIARYTADAFISRGRVFEPEALPPMVQSQLSKTGWITERVAA